MFDLMLEPWIVGDMMTLGLIEEIEDVMEVVLMDEPIVEHYLEEDNYIEENNTLEDRSIEESIKEEIIKEGVCEMENKKEERRKG